MRPTLRQLEYFVAVAKTLNFRKAAEACLVTQPALSTQIKQLEKMLGVTLFERNRRSVMLTPAGEEILERVRDLLGEVDAVVKSARGHAEPLSGRLRLGVIPTVAPYLLPPVLPHIRSAYPDLKLLLREAQTNQIVASLQAGRLDMLILALPEPARGIETTPLFQDDFLLVMPAGHRLSKKRKIRECHIEAEDVLLLEDGHCLRDQALSICKLAGAIETADFRATSLKTLTQMVASGIGITLLPRIAVDAEVGDAAGLVVRPFAAPVPGRQIGMAWRRSSTRRPGFRLLAELFKAHAPE